MLKSFYNYLVKGLILEFFKNHEIENGNRYYLIIENEEYRNGVMGAIATNAEPITISGVYHGICKTTKEIPYETYVLRPGGSSPDIIIGYDKTAHEDYLTSIRNAVGLPGGKYENYCVLYILSDSVLSSIISATKDLQSIDGPLNSDYIIDDIQEKAKDLLHKDIELQYLQKHLERISNFIDDGSCSLFDFQHALGVLAEGKLKEHYNELYFFNDKSVYDGAFKPTNLEMKDRVEENQILFQKIDEVFKEDDDQERLKSLEKILDEKLSRKIVNNPNWKLIDFQEYHNSRLRKAETASLELLDVELENSGFLSSMVYSGPKGNVKKRTTNYILICDEVNNGNQKIKVTFNKDIKQAVSGTDWIIHGQTAQIAVSDKLIKQSIGKNDNHHDFFMLRVPFGKEFFKEISQNFSINKRGEIIVTVPQEAETLTFGNGSNILQIPLDGKVEWAADSKLIIPVVTDDDNDTIEFTVSYQDKELKFILKLYAAQPIPPVGPEFFPKEKIYHGIELNGLRFGKITDGETERPIKSYWRKYLEWEQSFLDNDCTNIEYGFNDVINDDTASAIMLQLPSSVNKAFHELLGYYRQNETIPSLCPINEALKSLLESYWKSVCDAINDIHTSRALAKEEYNLTKLGTIKYNERVYFTPFHPLLVSYALEHNKQYDSIEDSAFAEKLLSPFYLLPFIYYNDKPMRPYGDKESSAVRNWLCYENVDSKPQDRINDITEEMVYRKMEAFIHYFSYLFQDKDCPIIINTIGIHDDTNVIKGIIEFIKQQYISGVQRIELHEYVNNLMDESFFEKLNRLDSNDAVCRELESVNISIESKEEYNSQEIIHQLFTRVSYYKHDLNESNEHTDYCHIAFYQMDTGSTFIKPNTDESRTELAFNGLISIPSTLNKGDSYIIGFGTKEITECEGYIYPMTIAMNNLYANEENEGSSIFHNHTCVAKKYKFSKSALLNSIYDNSNWVTFINPEVDINFFYKQDLYIVHYTDQYTINAKYDSITVTKHIEQYENMLKKPYEKYCLSADRFQDFNDTMRDYFNCLNGSWMLETVRKTEAQIREKMSIVATCVSMLQFMKRNQNVIWVPISLDEILRVTGSIRLPQDYIFTKKSLGVKGAMSDDLLMMGLDDSSNGELRLYMYPIEVKASKNGPMAEKAGKQVSQTYRQLKEHLYGNSNFIKNIYKTFFASQFLTNSEKLNANSLLANNDFEKIESHRYELLNLKYSLVENLPIKEMGNAAIVSYFENATHSLRTTLVDDVPVCEIHFSERECFEFVAEPEKNTMSFLENGLIQIDQSTDNAINSPVVQLDDATESDVEIAEIECENGAGSLSAVPIKDNNTSNGEIIHEINKEVNNAAAEDHYEEGTAPHSINIIIGHTKSGNREIVFEANNTRMVSHPNIGVIGTMGTGKTQLARSVIAQFAKEQCHNIGGRPVGMLVFDYKGDYKDKPFLDAVGGSSYKFNYPFNPLKLVINDEVEGMNLPAITADRISDSFAKAYGLGLKQQSCIKQVIIDTYTDAGITKDPSTWNNSVPTMEQVIDKYFEQYDSNDKAYALFDKLRDYTIFTTDNSSCVSLFEWLDRVRVIDLTLYPDDTKKVIVSLILDLFYAEMRQLGASKQDSGFRELRAMIMVDEAHQFLKKDFNSFRSIISEGRMFGVGMILSTQNISDFKTSKEDYSQFILSWIIHHVNSISKSEISSIFGASDPNGEKYMDFINRAKLFESICKLGSAVSGIRDLPFFELVNQDERFQTDD